MRRAINFGAKLLCLAAIFLFFGRYQVIASNIAEVEAENHAQVEAAEAHNKEVEAKMLADQGIEQKGFYKDGTYTGTGQGYGGTVEAEIIVENGFVTEITVKDAAHEDPVYLDQAKKLLKRKMLQRLPKRQYIIRSGPNIQEKMDRSACKSRHFHDYWI